MKLIFLGIVVLLILGAGVFGAATFGLVNIPGISPTKFGKSVAASADPKRGFFDTFANPLAELVREDQKAQAAVKTPPPLVAEKVAKTHPEAGDEKLAELWDAIEPAKLVAITDKWAPNNLARILVKMDGDQVSALLSVLPTDRAVKLSKAIQQYASLPPEPDQPGA